MLRKEFAIVAAALRIGLGFDSEPFRHQVKRLQRYLNEAGYPDQAVKVQAMLDPPPDPYPDARVVLSGESR